MITTFFPISSIRWRSCSPDAADSPVKEDPVLIGTVDGLSRIQMMNLRTVLDQDLCHHGAAIGLISSQKSSDTVSFFTYRRSLQHAVQHGTQLCHPSTCRIGNGRDLPDPPDPAIHPASDSGTRDTMVALNLPPHTMVAALGPDINPLPWLYHPLWISGPDQSSDEPALFMMLRIQGHWYRLPR